jgi:DNA topoisomerase IB
MDYRDADPGRIADELASVLKTPTDYLPVPADGATKAALVEVVKAVAAQLGNTPAVCRKSYIHPDLIESWEKGEFHAVLARVAPHARASGGLSADEKLTLAFLAAWQRRKPKSLKQALARSVAKVKKAS